VGANRYFSSPILPLSSAQPPTNANLPFPAKASAARDLETFAKHAGRATVTTDDVLLLARRNEGLETLLRGFVEQLRVAEGRSGGGKGTTSRAGRGAARARGRGRGRGRV